MIATQNNINTFLYTPGKYFVIPDFQRPYSWDKANIASFIADLESVLAGNKKHYFGSIVYINEGNNSTIIDGQQRATTVLLMLTALYHIRSDHPEIADIPAEVIKENYLYNRHSYTVEQNRIKLRTVTTDNTIFEQIFNRSPLAPNGKDSKLYQAYSQFYEYFKDKTELEKYVNVLENFEVVTIALNASDDNPQKIFESINSTGKPLTDGDKIRNFALMLNDKTARNVVLKNYWEIIEFRLTNLNNDYISDFFKYYLTSELQREVKIEQVYPEFKKLFYAYIGEDQTNLEKLEAFYGKVLAYLNHYSFLKFNIDEMQDYQTVADEGFRLNFLKIETPYPFFMRVLDEYQQGLLGDNDLTHIFKMIETYLTRRIVCNIPTTGSNKLFASLHKDIKYYLSEYTGSTYVDVLGYILSSKSGGLRMPKKAEIEGAINSNPMYLQRNYYINFVLTSVDDQSRESGLLKQLANADIQLSIEHIMPQTLNTAWKNELGETYEQIHAQYLHTLPNLTLTGYNSKYSNNDFATKKTIENGFNESPLAINQFIRSTEHWDRNALEKRAGWWLEQIEKIWPVPVSPFLPKTEETTFIFGDDKDLTGSRVKAVHVQGEITECDSWSAVFETVLRKLFSLNEDLYDYITSEPYLYRYIKSDKTAMRMPNAIDGTPYFYENNTNTNRKRDIIVRLTEHLDMDTSDIKVILAHSARPN